MIITDDLVMEGVRQFAGDAEIAVRAVQAGNDMLCCTDFEVQVPAVIKAVETGEITEERLNESVLRILKMKIELPSTSSGRGSVLRIFFPQRPAAPSII